MRYPATSDDHDRPSRRDRNGAYQAWVFVCGPTVVTLEWSMISPARSEQRARPRLEKSVGQIVREAKAAERRMTRKPAPWADIFDPGF